MVRALLVDWEGVWARDRQLPPPWLWRIWLILAGRGFGKSRTGAEYVRDRVEKGKARRIGLLGATAADVRDTMIEGESGLLAISSPWCRPHFEPSKRRLTWPNGARATLYSAEEPERLRGPQHDLVWGDELAAWGDFLAWDMMLFGLRLGKHPQVVVTTTPKPIPLLLQLVKDSEDPAKGIAITKGNTYENKANLAPTFLADIARLYEGTRLGRQELHAEILDDVEGALFSLLLIDETRVREAPQLERIVIAVDPARQAKENCDDSGIVVVGKGYDGHAYVLEDLTLKGSPYDWARAATVAFYTHRADKVIGEVNNGGDMVETTIHSIDPNLPFDPVQATRGKAKRAEPIAALYQQKKVHHVGNKMKKLEKQMARFTGINGKRDDRVDALCWGLHYLMFSEGFSGLV